MRASLLILILLVSSVSRAESTAQRPDSIEESGPTGVLIYFKGKLSKSQDREFSQFHKKLNLVVSQKGDTFHFVSLKAKNGKVLTEKLYKRLCRQFEKKRYVKSCHADRILQVRQQGDVTSGGGTTSGASSAAPRCQLMKSAKGIKYKGKSDYWAEEAVGADLVDKDQKKSGKKRNIPVYVCDSPKDNHNHEVKSIVDGQDKKSDAIIGHCKKREDALKLLDDVAKKHKGKTAVVNYSMGSGSRDWEKKDFLPDKEKLKDVIIVQASGNNFAEHPDLERGIRERAKNLAFHVGSLSHTGIPSSFSNEGKQLDLLSPSDKSNTSCPANSKKCVAFGYTSGAAPMASRAFDRTLRELPTLSKSQIFNLARSTAVKVPSSFEKKQKNGKGMLNAYKMVAVAKKVAKACKGQSKKCIDKALAKGSASYQFENEFDDKKLKETFPQCHGGSSQRSCNDEKENFEKLRRAAFLNPDDKKLWGTIACIQKQQGNHLAEKFYKNIGRDFNKEPFKAEELGIESIGADFMRATRYMKGNVEEAFNTLPISTDKDDLKDAYKVARRMGEMGRKVLLKGVLDPKSPFPEPALTNAMQTKGIDRVSLVQKAAASPNPEARKAAMINAKELKEKGLSVLRKGVSDSDKEVRLLAVEEGLNYPKSHPYFAGAGIKDKDEDVRATTMSIAKEMGKKGITYLEKGLRDSSEHVQGFALEAIDKNLGRDHMRLLREGMKSKFIDIRRSAYTKAALDNTLEFSDFERGLVSEKDSDIHATLLRSAGRFGRKGLPFVDKATTDPNEDIREAAALAAVGYISKNKFVDRNLKLLRRLTKDSSKYVRGSAQASLEEAQQILSSRKK